MGPPNKNHLSAPSSFVTPLLENICKLEKEQHFENEDKLAAEESN